MAYMFSENARKYVFLTLEHQPHLLMQMEEKTRFESLKNLFFTVSSEKGIL